MIKHVLGLLMAAQLLLTGIPCSTAANAAPVFSRDKLAGLIHEQLITRYQVKDYQLYPHQDKLATYTLVSGETLTYGGQGQLLSSSLPDGTVTQYKNGMPVSRYQGGKLLSQTRIKDGYNRLQHSITHTKHGQIQRLYDHHQLILEIDQQRDHLVIRRGFDQSSLEGTITYFEVDSQNGLTYWIKMNKYHGMLIGKWRVTGGLMRDWLAQYQVCRAVMMAELANRYSDPLRLRKDSFNQTEADLLLPLLKQLASYPLQQFLQDIEKKNIAIDPSWHYVDFKNVILKLPKITLNQLPAKVIRKARVKNKKVFYWDQDKKDWYPYDFDPTTEKILPLGTGNRVIIEPRFIQDQWQVDKTAVDYYVFRYRLLIPEEQRYAIKEAMLDRDYVSRHENDLTRFIQKAEDTVRRAQASLGQDRLTYQLGEPLAKLPLPLAQQLQVLIAGQQKQRLLGRRDLREKDVNQLSGKDLMLTCMNPGQVLSVPALNRQKNKLYLKVNHQVKQISYRALRILYPQIEKKKIYTYYRKVKQDRGLIKIWIEDKELPEKGFWQVYSMRPFRDKLIEQNGQLLIRSDQGRFQWHWQGKWTSELVSGQLFLPNNSSAEMDRPLQAINSVNHTASRATPQARPAADYAARYFKAIDFHKGQPNVSLGFFQKWFKTIDLKQSVETGYMITLRHKVKLPGRRQIEKFHYQDDGAWTHEWYDADNRLLGIVNHHDQSYLLEYDDDAHRVRVVLNQPIGKIAFIYQNDCLTTIKLPAQLSKSWVTGNPWNKLVYRRGEQPILTSYYSQNRLDKHIFADTSQVTYTYHKQQHRISLRTEQDKSAWLNFSKQGKVLDMYGEKALLNLIFLNAQWLKPQGYKESYNRFVSE